MTEHTGDDLQTAKVMRLVERIKPMFGGQEPAVIGAALADLTALLLAGHIAETPAKTRTIREAMLKHQIRAIKMLVPLHEEQVRERMRKAQEDAKDRPN